MLFGKKTSRVLSVSFSLSLSCKFRVSNETKKNKEFGLSPLCTQKENVRALFVESSGGVRPNLKTTTKTKKRTGKG